MLVTKNNFWKVKVILGEVVVGVLFKLYKGIL